MSQLLSEYPRVVTMHPGKVSVLRVSMPWHPDLFAGQSLLLRIKPGQKPKELLDRFDQYWGTLRELLRQQLESGTRKEDLELTSYLTFKSPIAENEDVQNQD